MRPGKAQSECTSARVHGATVAGLLVLLASLAACSTADSDPELELQNWVARGELAAEEKNRSELLSLISVDYVDARGNDYQEIGNKLRAYFLYQNSISLLTSIDEISVSGETAATVATTVGVAETHNTRFGFDADAYQFEFELAKADDEWLLISARWGAIGRELR